MKGRDKKRIKKLIYHFEDSPKSAVYELDEEGKHKNLKIRAHRTNYKKLDKEKKQAFNLQKKEDHPAETMIIDQTFSQNHELLFEEHSFNFNEETKTEYGYFENTYCDQLEPYCPPLNMSQENEYSFRFSLLESDDNDYYNSGLDGMHPLII